MAFSCGFYNSIDKDRLYSATQFGEMFDGLITDGVYATIGECFMTVPGTGVGVVVKSGRAWFNKTWSVNTADLPLDLGLADLLLPRIDTVILEVDTRVSIRNNSIKVVTGYPAVNPTPAALTNDDAVFQYPLAYVTVPANASQIEKTNINIQVGKAPCPFVTGILQSADITDMFQQWEGQFEDWFAEMKTILDDDVVGNILHQLDQKVNISDKATEEDALLGTSDSKWMTPLMVKKAVPLNEYDVQVSSDASWHVRLSGNFVEMWYRETYGPDPFVAGGPEPNERKILFIESLLMPVALSKKYIEIASILPVQQTIGLIGFGDVTTSAGYIYRSGQPKADQGLFGSASYTSEFKYNVTGWKKTGREYFSLKTLYVCGIKE